MFCMFSTIYLKVLSEGSEMHRNVLNVSGFYIVFCVRSSFCCCFISYVYGVYVAYMCDLYVHACVQRPGQDIKYSVLTLCALYS